MDQRLGALRKVGGHARRLAPLVVPLALLLVLALLWRFTPLHDQLDARAAAGWLGAWRGEPWAPLVVVSIFVAAGLLVIPLNVLVLATVLGLGGALGGAYAMLGAMAGGEVSYLVGRWLGRRHVERLLGDRVNRVQRWVRRGGLLAVIALRVVPVAPYTIVNVAMGAAGVTPGHYALGTLLGLLPGIGSIALLGDRIIAVLRHPGWGTLGLLLAAAVVVGSALLLLQRRLLRRQDR